MITILIVDDEPGVLESIDSFVRKHFNDGYHVLSTNVSRQAREILQMQPVDILLADINMPGFTGFDLSDVAKKNHEGCRVLFLTGYSSFDYAYRALKSSCEDFILKSAEESEIVEAISNAVNSIREAKEKEELIIQAQKFYRLTNPKEGSDQEYVIFIQKYIQDHIDQDILLNTLAKKVHLHPVYLSRLFHQETGFTITDYITHLRIEHSRKLLRDTDLQVQEIALRVGLDSPVYFSRIFKRETGLSPQEYRRCNPNPNIGV